MMIVDNLGYRTLKKSSLSPSCEKIYTVQWYGPRLPFVELHSAIWLDLNVGRYVLPWSLFDKNEILPSHVVIRMFNNM